VILADVAVAAASSACCCWRSSCRTQGCLLLTPLFLFKHLIGHVVAASADPADDDAAVPKRRGRKPKTASADAANEEQLIPQGPAAADAADLGDGKRKRGRKTKAELQQMQQQVDQQLQQQNVNLEWGGDYDEEQQAMQAGLLVPAEGPGSWADAAATGAGEEDRRRFPYHR
jgi:hypothetical protein